MRVHRLALIAAFALFASVDAKPSAPESEITTAGSSILSRSLTANQRNHPSKRLLRTLAVSGEDVEERGISIPVIEKAKTFLTPSTVTKEMFQRWLTNEKSAESAFARLHLTKAGDKLFDNPKFFEWISYVDDLNVKLPGKASKIATLTTQYSDEALSQIIIAAKKVSGTEGLATKLQTEQIHSWLNLGKSPDDVFKYLMLSKTGDDLLTSPELVTWTKYMNLYKTKNPSQTVSLYATVAAHYSDDAFAKLVEAAKNVQSTASVAKRLEATKIQSWLAAKKTPDNVFVLLKLDEAGYDVLASPQLNTWANYLKTFNKEKPDEQTTLIAALTRSYGEGGAVKLLEAAKKVPSTEKMATNLEAAQLQRWLNSNKKPADVFKVLNLDRAGDGLLSSPQFMTFMKYTDDFKAKNLGMDVETMWTLRGSYDDLALVKMIIAGEKIPSAQNAAKRLEGELFKNWMAPPTLNNPGDIFKLLKLDEAGDTLFTNPLFSYWIRFLDDYNKAVPGKNIPLTMVTTTYKDEDLMKMIDAARKEPTMKNLANRLETEVLKQFIFAEKQPLDVAKLLHVQEKTDANWKLWKKYLQDYNKYHLRGITTR